MEFRDTYFALLLYMGVNFIAETSAWVATVTKFTAGISHSPVN